MDREEKRPQVRKTKRENRRGRSVVKSVLFTLFTLMLIGICTVGIVAGIFVKYVETNITPVVQVDADDYTMELSSFIYYQDSETGAWEEYQTIHADKNRVLVELEDMPEALWQAAVAIEDHRFFEHNGVDWKRTGGAVVNMFIGMRDTFGGSTLTQQMLKNMTKDNKPYVNRKVREIFRALEFEKNNTKWEILELYLNAIYLGQGCYGVQTAAQFYFGKDVGDLTPAECASLIAITNNPSMYGPMSTIEITVTNDDGTKTVKTPRELNKERQELILKRMAGGNEYVGVTGLDYLTMEEAEAACAEELQFTDGSVDADEIVTQATGGVKINNWFVDEVIRDVSADLAEKYHISVEEAQLKLYGSGYHIYTTMDPEIQDLAESVYEDRSNLDLTSRDGQPIQSGITIMDPYTGDIKAIVGAMGEKEGNLLSNYATMNKQVGSSIKPLTVYAPALDAGVVTPGSTFDDYPVEMMNETHWPKNSPNKYRGWTSVTTGVQHSINTIAVQTLQTVGVPEAYAFATEKLNLGLAAEDMDRSPLGMGGLTYGLDTVEMAAAYSAFVNNGIYTEPRTYVRVEDAEGNVILENETESHVAMKETTAYLMNKLLKNAVAAGTGTQARFSGMTIAGKTGTTTDNCDRYFVGYTPYYVAAVWTGYKYSAKISYDGGNPSITMWKKVMEPLHEELENKDFTKPSSGLTTVKICADSGLLCSEACLADVRGSREVTIEVVKGTEPTETCTLHTFANYCTEGQCLPTDLCPVWSVSEVGLISCERADYGPEVVAEDAAYTVQGLEKIMGLVPTIAEDGTEIYPEVIGCPVHNAGYVIPDYPILDPNDPNYNPLLDPNSEFYDPTKDPYNPSYIPPVTEEEGVEEPGEPVDTPQPGEPGWIDPTGGFGDAGGDWWQDFWSEP